MHMLLLLAALASAPQPSPTPLKTIVNIHSREMCTVLHENLAPAIGGVLANDSLVASSQIAMNRLGGDAVNEAAGGMGGAGVAATMDTMRMQNLVTELVQNIEKIEKILADSKYRGKDESDAAALAAVNSRLETVLAQQKYELNLLSFIVYSNQGTDLMARQDPTGGIGQPPPSMQADITPLSAPQQLFEVRKAVRHSEDDAAAAVMPIIRACK